MKKPALMMVVVIAGVVLISGFFVQAAEETLGSKLVRELGVTEKQASGGAGALLKHAQNSLGEADFGKVTKALPEVTSLIKAAPESMGQGMGAGLGKGLEKLGGMAGVTKVFSTLGMKPDMVGKFVPSVLSYAESKGGAPVMEILKNVLK